MKLSEAMLQGSEQTGVCRGSLLRVEHGKLCACALGAAIYAVSKRRPAIDEADLEDWACKWFTEATLTFRELNAKRIHPVKCLEMDVIDIILDLNDNEYWPRLAIAQWLKEQGL